MSFVQQTNKPLKPRGIDGMLEDMHVIVHILLTLMFWQQSCPMKCPGNTLAHVSQVFALGSSHGGIEWQ